MRHTIFNTFILLIISLSFLLKQNSYAQWLHQNSGTNVSLGWIYFLNADTGWIVGNSGTILKTTSGGKIWIAVPSGTSENLAQVYFVDSTIGWVCGESGTILKTTNGGLKWVEQVSGTSNVLCDVQFVDSKTGWIVGGDNVNNHTNILKTTNGGINWFDQVNSSGPLLYSLFFIDSKTGWAAGDFSKILKTTDGGLHWLTQYEGSKQAGFHSVFFTDYNNGWAVGWDGVMMRTTDGGNSWLDYSRGIGVVWVDIFFVNIHNGWIVGFDYVGYPRMIKTTDGGENWFLQNLPISAGLNSIYFADINTGWVTGYLGTILNTTNGGVNFYKKGQSENEIPDQYPISQDYPDDRNSPTILSYSVPQSSRIKIKIFDLIGNEIRTMVDKENIRSDKDSTELEEVKLAYDQNNIRLEFVTHYYSYPAKNRFKYKLENFDKNWIDAGTQRIATYTNLDPGEYFFKVIESNLEGGWKKEGISLKIIISPPLWATTWAYLLYVILAFSLIYFLWKFNVRRLKTKHEYEMSKFETDKLHEVDEMKSRFFANISHEFRTPLTLILGPAKDIIEKSKDNEIKQNAGLIKRSANRLLGLVNQLLDLSKLEAGKMKLETRQQNIIPLLKGLVLSFSSLAERKKITLRFNSAEEKINVYLDRDKIEKIIINLLSNAFKFTPDEGKIEVNVMLPTPSVPLPGGDVGVGQKRITPTKYVEISISDSGLGIPKEDINKVFERFYQVDGSHTREQEGTGIGLALTKELVELHRGKIEVESEEGKGTTFIVRIPLGKNHLKPEEIIEKKTETLVQSPKDDFELVTETTNRKEKTDIDLLLDTDKPLLLVVEDNNDVRKYIISHLEDIYRIQEAVDGEDGLKEAFNHIPDLIISDVMMPKMDGFELCNKLKTDERTSHIPIIMLTAKATSHDKISGYETGADDYIMKPFDAAELKIRIKNLIEIRRRLQEKFTKADFIIKRGDIKINSLDEKFIGKLMIIIEKHISEENFTIEEFESEIAMSKSQIYRKLKALTGKSPSRFLRSVRLSKARKMIQEKQSTISEIAYSTGFGSPAYFTRCFKDEYGYSPSEMK